MTTERKLAMAGGIAALVLALVVALVGDQWVSDMTEAEGSPGNPMTLVAVLWMAAAVLAFVASAPRLPPRVTLAVCLEGIALGFAGVVVSDVGHVITATYGPPSALADPRDHAYLAVLWLPVVVLLAGAAAVTVWPRLTPRTSRQASLDRSSGDSLLRTRSARDHAVTLAALAASVALALALLIGLRGEMWVSRGSAWPGSFAAGRPRDPLAWPSLTWGLSALIAFAGAFLMARGRRLLGASCAAAAATFGLASAIVAGSQASAEIVAMLAHTERVLLGSGRWMVLADPTHRRALALAWLVALVPLLAAAGLAVMRRPAQPPSGGEAS